MNKKNMMQIQQQKKRTVQTINDGFSFDSAVPEDHKLW